MQLFVSKCRKNDSNIQYVVFNLFSVKKNFEQIRFEQFIRNTMFQCVAGVLFFTRTAPDDQILSARVKNQNYEILNNKMNEMLQLCLFGFSVQKQKCVGMHS